MFRLPILAAVLATITATSHGHFLFVHVLGGAQPRTELHFAESCWDFSADPRMVTLMSNVQTWTPGAEPEGAETTPYAMVLENPGGSDTVCAAFTYGIMRRGGAFLLEYQAKGVSGLEHAATPGGLVAEILATPADDRLVLTVLHHGKPAPGAEIVVPVDATRVETMATDASGRLEIPMPKTPLFAIRAMVPETRQGEHDGEPYEQVRYYTTLTVHPTQSTLQTTGDPLAAAVLADAMSCHGLSDATGADWRGRLQGRVGGTEVRGGIVSSPKGMRISVADASPGSSLESLRMLESLDDATALTSGNPVFGDDRTATADSTISLPGRDTVVRIVDRRIVSMKGPSEAGSRRVDVLDWTTTEEGHHVPSRVLLTDFDDEDRMVRSAIVSTTYSEDLELRVPGRYTGTIIGPSGGDDTFSVQVTDVRVSTP